MFRKHENSDAWKAGMYAVAVHAVLLAGMLFSFNWKAAHPVLNITEVELWDKLPDTPPPPVMEAPKPEIKEEPKAIVEEKPVVEEKPKPEEPKVDIELENKKKELKQKEVEAQIKKEKELEQKHKKDEATKKLAQMMRDEDLSDKKADEKKQKDALKKMQQDMLSDENAASDRQASAANVSVIGEYTEKIKAKIRGNVNKTLCGEGNPEIRIDINVLPTGQLNGSPKITKPSGNSACDDAVERAIIASEPLPLPSDPDLVSKFRNLSLKFRPND